MRLQVDDTYYRRRCKLQFDKLKIQQATFTKQIIGIDEI